MVFYCLDTESDEWNIEYATYIKNNYRYQILEPQLFTIIKFDDDCNELDSHVFYNKKHLLHQLITYLKDEIIESKQKALRIYCHNLDFDIKFLVSILTKNHFKLKPIRKNRLLSMKVFTSKANPKDTKKPINKLWFDFRDSYALLPLSIKSLGTIIGLPKLEIDYKFKEITPEIIEYCKRDNQIVAKSLLTLIELFKKFGYATTIPELPLTIPSLSLKLFLEKNKKYEILKEIESSGKIIKKSLLFDVKKKDNEYFRKYYFGGKTECYNFNIAEDIIAEDKNSLFPYEMKSHKFPIPPYLPLRAKNLKESDISENTFAILCEIDESKELYPLIPERNNDKKVIFSNSKHKIHMLQPEEYWYLKSRNNPLRIIELWNCASWDYLFNYFDEIYNIRLEFQKNDNKLEALCKLPPNSTYGKFAQNCDITERTILPLNEIESDKLYELMLANKIDNVCAETHSYEFSKKIERTIQLDNINVIFSMRITALARLNITKDQHILQKHNIPFYYTDTDSIYCHRDALKVLDCGKALGQLKTEQELQAYLCCSPKEYLCKPKTDTIAGMSIFVEKSKIKGLPGNSNFSEYIENGITTIRPTKIFESWVRQIPMNSAITTLKQKRTFYQKRYINKDLTTKPIQSINKLHTFENHNSKIIRKQIKKWNEKYD